jgi:hypothetical protein
MKGCTEGTVCEHCSYDFDAEVPYHIVFNSKIKQYVAFYCPNHKFGVEIFFYGDTEQKALDNLITHINSIRG